MESRGRVETEKNRGTLQKSPVPSHTSMFQPPASPWISGTRGLDAAAVAAAFVGGALLGSFLNVVVHRVPRGGSVVTGRSRCPACGAAIGPFDLVPIVGWLLLRGRCRRCAAPIAARYPLVEMLCGALLAALAAGEVAAGPGGWPGFSVWAARAALLVTILAWTLLASDAHDVSSLTVAVAVGAAATVSMLPGMQPPGIGWCGTPWPRSQPWAGPPLSAIVGAAGGWVAGQAAAGSFGRRAGALVGAALGWQAAVLVALTASLACAVLRTGIPWRTATPRMRAAAAVMGAVAAIVIGWRPLLAAWRQCCQALG